MRYGMVLSLAVLGLACQGIGTDRAAQEELGESIAALRLAARDGRAVMLGAVEGPARGACDALVQAGPKGSAALKRELSEMERRGERDDRFRLWAAALLWQIGGCEEAQAVAECWSGEVALQADYVSVFSTAFEAARTRDPRVLPILVAILRDQEGKLLLAQHSLQVVWPLTHEIVWGVFGSEGPPALLRVLREAKEETTLASAVYLLSLAQRLDALDEIRAFARKGSSRLRAAAIGALGRFGHPTDFEFLASGLDSKGKQERLAFLGAVLEYGDLRVVPRVVRLLEAEEDEVVLTAISCLEHLRTYKGIQALRSGREKLLRESHREACRAAFARTLSDLDLTYKEFGAKTAEEITKVIAAERERKEEKYRLNPWDRKLSREEFLEVIAEWRLRRRTRGGAFAWVEDRHVLAAAKPDDIPSLLDVAAACYERLSDEGLWDARRILQLVRRLGRSRYRREVEICEKVELIE